MDSMPRLTRTAAAALLAALVLGLSLAADLPECMSAPDYVLAAPQSWWDDLDLLSRVVMGEAT